MKPSLGEYLKKKIVKIPKMSIRNLERKSGVSNSEICKIINGNRKNPNPHLLKSIARPLKVDYKFLYYLAGYIDTKDWKKIENEEEGSSPAYTRKRDGVAEEVAIYSLTLSPEEQELIENFRAITDHEVRYDILRHVRLALKSEGRSSRD